MWEAAPEGLFTQPPCRGIQYQPYSLGYFTRLSQASH